MRWGNVPHASRPTGDQGLPARRGGTLGRSYREGRFQTEVLGGAACLQTSPGDPSALTWLMGGFSRGSTLTLSVLRCSDKFTRFCQWKNVELNIHVSRDNLRVPGAPPGSGTW